MTQSFLKLIAPKPAVSLFMALLLLGPHGPASACAEDEPTINVTVIGEIYASRHEEVKFDIGTVAAGSNLRCAVRLINDLSSDYVITGSKSTCGCLVGVTKKGKVAAGNDSLFLIGFTPKASGKSAQEVIIEGTVSEVPWNLRFVLPAVAKPAFTLQPTSFTLDEVDQIDISVSRNFDSDALDDVQFRGGLWRSKALVTKRPDY